MNSWTPSTKWTTDPSRDYHPFRVQTLVRLSRATIASGGRGQFSHLENPVWNLRDILDAILFFYRGSHIIWQLARYFGRVHAPNVAVEPLPLRDPRLAGIGEGDETLKDLRRAAVDLVWRTLEMEEFLAVGTAFLPESLDEGVLCVSRRVRISLLQGGMMSVRRGRSVQRAS